MSLLSFNIFKNNLPDGTLNYSLNAEEETSEGIVKVEVEQLPIDEIENLSVGNLISFEITTTDVYGSTREGEKKLCSYPLQQRIVLSQINYDIPESRKFYSYEDALSYYKHNFDLMADKNKKLQNILSEERKQNEKVNKRYKKVIQSLNRLIGELLKK